MELAPCRQSRNGPSGDRPGGLFCVSACRLQNSPCGFLADPKSVRVTTMIDEKLARRRAHENNIARYRRLLQTRLSDVERHFIESRPCRRADCPVNACSCSIVTLAVIGRFYLINKHSMLEANPVLLVLSNWTVDRSARDNRVSRVR
jgi:hypothetical protein